MAKWFLNSFLTSIFIFAPFSVFAEKFSAAKHVKYHIRSRAEPNFTAHSLKKFPSDSNAKSHFVHENRLNFNSSRPTRIFVHGFYSDSGLMESYAKAYLNAGDFNFIAVDWLAGAKTLNYPKARHRVREVGEALAVFIDHLVGIGMNLEHLILVGHSLGAHVCGFAGKSVKSGKIPIIVGLDPALPLFSLKNKGHRLAYTDARYVQIIHTSGGFLGIKHAIGHADFYPNYGCKQPGCSGLSSGKAHLHFVQRKYSILFCGSL